MSENPSPIQANISATMSRARSLSSKRRAIMASAASCFSSTCAIYGTPDRMPITEDMPQRPINPYGLSKLMVEQMLASFGHAHGLKSIALRYFNAAGADPETETGEDHDPETHLIPLVLDAASGRRDAITVFGTDYDTPDGTCLRDYIHVSDLADAHVLALEALQSGRPRAPTTSAPAAPSLCGRSLRRPSRSRG